MIRFLTNVAILALSCRVCMAAEYRHAAISCPPASGWETNVASGNSLAWNFKAPVVYWRYTPLLSPWHAALLAEEPEVPSLGYWKVDEQRLYYVTHFPNLLRGGWVADDLVNKSLVLRHTNGKEHLHYQADGMVAASLYSDESDVPAPALVYWKIDVDGFLRISDHQDMHAPFRMQRLLKRMGDKLLVEVNGKEIVLEYLPRQKK